LDFCGIKITKITPAPKLINLDVSYAVFIIESEWGSRDEIPAAGSKNEI